MSTIASFLSDDIVLDCSPTRALTIIGNPTHTESVNPAFANDLATFRRPMPGKGLRYAHRHDTASTFFNPDDGRTFCFVDRRPLLVDLIKAHGGMETVAVDVDVLDQVLDKGRLGEHALVSQSWDNVFFMAGRHGGFYEVHAYRLPWGGGWRIKAEEFRDGAEMEPLNRYFLGTQVA